MNQSKPPAWAEEVLRILLAAKDRETVRGDLLEQYREDIEPMRGRRKANRWYLTQVAGFAWRPVRLWALLFAVTYVSRGVLDGLLPTNDFATRAAVSTVFTFAAFVGCGATAAWRTGLARSGALAGIVTAAVAPFFAGALNALFFAALAVAGNDHAFVNIQRAGGVSEAFLLPFMVMGAGMLLATIGGIAGALARRASHVVTQ
jgi:hypothetical protein